MNIIFDIKTNTIKVENFNQTMTYPFENINFHIEDDDKNNQFFCYIDNIILPLFKINENIYQVNSSDLKITNGEYEMKIFYINDFGAGVSAGIRVNIDVKNNLIDKINELIRVAEEIKGVIK